MGKIKEKFNSIRNNKTSAAFAVYFFVIIVLLAVQLVNCKVKGYESYSLGVQNDEMYEILDNHYIDTDFTVEYSNINSIILNGYMDNDIKFTDEKLIVDFIDEKTGENIQHSEILLKDQIDERNILILCKKTIPLGTNIKMRIRSLGCETKGPYIGMSKKSEKAKNAWVDGELSNNYICASINYRVNNYNCLKPCAYFVAELLTGIFVYVLYKKTKMPLVVKKTLACKNKKKKKIKIRRLSLILIITWIILFTFFDYVYMKTMDGTVRAKKPEVICENNDYINQNISLKKGDSLSQTFSVSDDNFSAVAVCLPNLEEAKVKIAYKLYDEDSNELLNSGKIISTKMETLAHHLNARNRNQIKGSIQDYYVLKFNHAISDSKGKRYRLEILNEKITQGDLVVKGGIGEEYSFRLNTKSMSGNLYLVALFSNQTCLGIMFKYMAVVVGILFSLLIIGVECEKISIEKTFIISAVVLTFVYSFLIPPYCVPDERAHIDATYIISNQILGIDSEPAPGRIYKRVEDIDPNRENTMDISGDNYLEVYQNLFQKAQNESLEIAYADNPVSNVTFLNYLPAAIGFSIARLLHLNMITMIMFGRWMNALAVIGLFWIGIKKIPFGKATIAILGLFPIVLQQISSCSYDGILIGAIVVYVAYAFKLIYTDEDSLIDFAIVFLSGGFAAAACKGGVYIPILGLFLLIFAKNFHSIKKGIIYTIGAAIPLGSVFLAQFSQRILSIVAPVSGSTYREGQAVYSISDFLHAPNKLIRIYQNTFALQGDTQLRQAVGGALGRLNVFVPWYILIAFIILVCISGLKQRNEKIEIEKIHKCYIGILAFASIILVMASMLFAWTQEGANYVEGIQGRYFFPSMLLMALLLRNERITFQYKNEEKLVVCGVFLNILTIGMALISVLY